MTCATLKRPWAAFEQVHSPEIQNKRPRYQPMCVSPTNSTQQKKSSSVFDITKMSADEITTFILDESDKHRARKENRMSMSPSHSGDSSDPDTEVEIHKRHFSFRQVHNICANIVVERDTKLQSVYNETLYAKLQEQYEMFLRFSRDQIQRHFSPDHIPSYLS